MGFWFIQIPPRSSQFRLSAWSLIIFLLWTFALHLYPFFSRLSRSDSPDSYDSNGTTYARRYSLVTELQRCGVCRTFVCPFLERSVLTQFLEFQGVSYVVGKVLARGFHRQRRRG